MPNTLAHIGIQSALTQRLLPESDLKWLYAGCVIPDLPWIIQRGVRYLFPSMDRYELLLYSGVQSSLFFCLALAAALALLTPRPRRVFLLLALTSLLHLLLDATQIKWANGVLLFAPFSWQLTSFGFYWPESPITVGLTLFGLCYLLLTWKQTSSEAVLWSLPGKKSLFAVGVLLGFYFLSPSLFSHFMLGSDNYYMQTLQDVPGRSGRTIAMDRAVLLQSGDGYLVRNFNDELFEVEGLVEDESSTVISLQGTFITAGRIQVREYHLHPAGRREVASMVGLGLIGLLWLCAAIRPVRRRIAAKTGYQPYRASWIRKK